MFAALCGGCAARVIVAANGRRPSAIVDVGRQPGAGAIETNHDTQQTMDQAAGWGRTFVWLGFSAIGSTLLLATTNHLCQDITSAPFLWVAPLILHLLSFVLCFDHAW